MYKRDLNNEVSKYFKATNLKDRAQTNKAVKLKKTDYEDRGDINVNAVNKMDLRDVMIYVDKKDQNGDFDDQNRSQDSGILFDRSSNLLDNDFQNSNASFDSSLNLTDISSIALSDNINHVDASVGSIDKYSYTGFSENVQAGFTDNVDGNTQLDISMKINRNLSDGKLPLKKSNVETEGIQCHINDIDISEEDRDLCMSQLYEEFFNFKVDPFFNITPREMPESPHHVIEESFKSNPWVILVATIFLTKTSAKVAGPFMKKFFEQYPSPLHVLDAEPTELEEYFDTLGLRKRGTMIWKMSYQFISGKWRRASDLCGIGKYGEDAYRLFCLGHVDIEPTDRYLRLYLDWLRTQTSHVENWSVADCEKIILDPIERYYEISLR